MLGLSRTAAAEFSFLVGLPILYGAGAVKLVSEREAVCGPLLWPMVVGTVVSFLAALVVVRPFVAFLRAHTFAPFAWYRIAAGAALAALCASGVLRRERAASGSCFSYGCSRAPSARGALRSSSGSCGCVPS